MAGLFVDFFALLEQGLVNAGVALIWGDEGDGAVAVFGVVPIDQLSEPTACAGQVIERFDGQFGAVFQGLECGLGVGVVVAHAWAAAGVAHLQGLHHGEHVLAFHGRAVV